MENTGVLNVELRTSTRKGDNNLLKKKGYLLANIVGKGIDSIAISVKRDEFSRMIKKVGRNAVFELTVSNGAKYTAMVKEIHIAPLKNDISHLDFQVVSLSEKMKQEVAIKIIGTDLLESKRLLVNSAVDYVLVEGLPQDIPDEIVLDVSDLGADESIEFKDIKLPEGITSSLDPNHKMVTVVSSKLHDETEEETEESE